MKFQKKKTVDTSQIIELAKRCNVSTVLSELLLLRGIDTPEKVKKYLYGTMEDFTSPSVFPQMDAVVSKILFAMENNKKITVYARLC